MIQQPRKSVICVVNEKCLDLLLRPESRGFLFEVLYEEILAQSEYAFAQHLFGWDDTFLCGSSYLTSLFQRDGVLTIDKFS